MSKKIEKMIKNKHILIIGSGSNLKKYWDVIHRFIKKNNVVTVACNRINHILTPDVHFWVDKKAYAKFGKEISKKSKVIFRKTFSEEFIRANWDGDYEVIKFSTKIWKDKYDDPKNRRYKIGVTKYNSKLKRFYGHFRTIGALSILWAHVNKASKISVVGMDGYTFYTKEELRRKECSQHCYGNGFSDAILFSTIPNFLKSVEDKDENRDAFYEKAIKKDEDIYKTLKAIEKYGAKFKILTPTVYEDFYNFNILGIKE
jgi:hypothetical protein